MNLYIFVVPTGHNSINTGINSHLCQYRIDRAQRAHLWPVWMGIIAGVAQTCCNASTAAWSTSLTRSRSRVLCTHTQPLINHARLVFTYRTHDIWCAHGRPSCQHDGHAAGCVWDVGQLRHAVGHQQFDWVRVRVQLICHL